MKNARSCEFIFCSKIIKKLRADASVVQFHDLCSDKQIKTMMIITYKTWGLSVSTVESVKF